MNTLTATPAGTTPTTVTPTPTSAPGCGAMGEGTAWYGRNREEGYWALTHYTTDYFLNTCSRQTGCNSQWVGVWWFKADDVLHHAARGNVIADWGRADLVDTGTRLHEAIATTTCWRNLSCTPTPTPTP